MIAITYADRDAAIEAWRTLTDDQQQFAVGVLSHANPEALLAAIAFTRDHPDAPRASA
ncbi:hypothetical protein [Rhodococcus opacus]|uniref:Uncharacterized protein n=1 Tax=Rhodococcus opacus (strain B4) TaxID=632772 RepID=C1B9F7_RHOOB|nr:hypothetical protein [Rhodococcus opacus]BAH52310.1 hypothetical protein ROP_40630 [Rhodococcus opacus B4]